MTLNVYDQFGKLVENRVNTITPVSNNRQMPDRSYLEFHFPTPKLKVRLPFFENIEVRESKRARISDQEVLGRSSTMHVYLGAQSRELSISFAMTLPHIEEYALQESKYKPKGQKNKAIEKTHFFTGGVSDFYRENWYDELLKTLEGDSLLNTGLYNTIFDNVQSITLNNTNSARSRAINIITYWVSIIRASVINNTNKPFAGPPLVRLNHGVLYQDIPMIVKAYNMDWDDTAGHDVITMLPRRLRISLVCDEVRIGDLGEHAKYVPVKRDNLAGYEVVLKNYNLDPGSIR